MVGDPQYQHTWDGATYRFTSDKHLQLFKADPDRYLPQYNNWCAASVAKGAQRSTAIRSGGSWWMVGFTCSESPSGPE